MASSTAARVRWTNEERARFYEAARSLGPPDGQDTKEVWRKAQEVAGFSKDRMRPFASADAADMNKERRKGRVTLAPKPPEVVEVKSPSPEELGLPLTPSEPEPPDASALDLRALAAEAISDVVLRVLYDVRIRAALRGLIAETIAPEPELEKVQALTWREPKLPIERKLRVVLTGPVPTDLEVPGLDLRFWGQKSGESLYRLRSLLEGADVAVVFSNAISHKAQYMIKARSNKLRIIYFSQGKAALKPELEKLAAENRNGTQ